MPVIYGEGEERRWKNRKKRNNKNNLLKIGIGNVKMSMFYEKD